MAHGRGASSEAHEVNEQPLRWPGEILGAAGREGTGMVEVALLWGDRLLDLQQFRAQEPPTLGHSPQARLHVFDRAVGERFELLRYEGSERFLRIPAEARFTCFDEKGAPLRAADGHAVREVPLRPGERAVVALAQLTVTVRDAGVTQRVRVNPFVAGDYAFFKIAAMTALCAIAMVAVGHVTLEHGVFVDDEVPLTKPTVLKTIAVAARPPPPPPVVKAVQEAKARATGTETSAAKPTPKGSPRGPTDINKVGLLALLPEGGPIFGPGGGRELQVALDNFGKHRTVAGLGPESGVGVAKGPGGGGGGGTSGLEWGGSVGTRPGGGGVPFGTLDGGGMRGRATPPSPEQQKIVGNGLDREDIARVIRRHQNEIKYCYENALREAPELAGKVAVSFVIGASGAVEQADVAETTLEHDGAEKCMLSRIRRWKFPEPRGGGVVAVNFPWLFKPVGGDAP